MFTFITSLNISKEINTTSNITNNNNTNILLNDSQNDSKESSNENLIAVNENQSMKMPFASEKEKEIKLKKEEEDSQKDFIIEEIEPIFSWQKIKCTKYSIIEYNFNKDEVIELLATFEDSFLNSSLILKTKMSNFYFKDKFLAHNQRIVLMLSLLLLIFSIWKLIPEEFFYLFFTIIFGIVCIEFFYSNFLMKRSTLKSFISSCPEPEYNFDAFNSEYKFLKISSVFPIRMNDILFNYIKNLEVFKEWNKYLFGISEYKNEEQVGSFIYSKSLGLSEKETFLIQVNRKTVCLKEEQASFVTESLACNQNIIRTFLLEEYKEKDQTILTKITIYIPMISLFRKEVPLSFIKSSLESLDILHFVIEENIFYKIADSYTHNEDDNQLSNE